VQQPKLRKKMTTRRSGVLMAAAVLGAALVASEPAVAFRGGAGRPVPCGKQEAGENLPA